MPVKSTKPKNQKLKVEKKEVKDVVDKAAKPKTEAAGLSVPLYSLEGKESGVLSLPKELFGIPVNKALLSQALRVYLNNLKTHFAHTKTRSEVNISTRKIYRQKGTGGARHGAKSAPIFVGGGVALGPKFRKTVLDLPKKMKQKALLSALSSKVQSKEVLGIEGLDKVSGKTKQMQKLIEGLAKNNTLLLLGEKNEQVARAVKNLTSMEVLTVEQINAYQIVSHQTVLLTKEAVEKLSSKMKGRES